MESTTLLINLAILVSGNGSNMEAILAKNIPGIKPCVVISNNKDALAIGKAKKYNVPVLWIDNSLKKEVFTDDLFQMLDLYNVTPSNGLICLAGFMRILTPRFVSAYKNRILNIHPSLLPSFPGKDAVAQALKQGVKITGCTVHFVDEGVDTGRIIKQAAVEVKEDDTEATLGPRIHEQEHKIYPEAIAWFVEQQKK